MSLSRVLSPVLVGRDSELSEIEDALLSALRGDGGVVIVGGEAGMGKTRLVNTLAARARRLGCAVLTGGCSEAQLSLPYLPFLEATGSYLAATDISPLRERLGPAGEELAHLFPQLGKAAPPDTDAGQAKLRLFESILILLRDAAGKRALLLILEDLQWADPSTRELLDYATRRLKATNVLVVATYRTDEMHRKHALLPTIQGWRRAGQVAVVELRPLSASGVADMVRAIFDEESISDEFRDFLRERSEGNPFVLEEMLRDALDRGDIYRTETGWDRKALAEIRMPPTVRDTILQRLERLASEDVAVLSAASVMGRSFDLQSLVQVTRTDESVILGALESSVNAQLIEPEDRSSGAYRFRHALTREAIYEDLVVPRRQQMHSRVADVLSARPDGAAVDIANHLFMANRNEEAVAMCVRASEDAVRAFAYGDSAQLLERAAPHAPEAVERDRLLARAADSYWNNGETTNARRLLEPAIAGLEKAGLKVEAAGYRLLLGRCWWELLRSDLAKEQFERARDILEAEGPSEGLAIAYMRLGNLLAWNAHNDESVEPLRRSLEIGEAAGAELARVWSTIFLGNAETMLGNVDRGFALVDEGYKAARAAGFRFQAFNATYNATWTAHHLGFGGMADVWAARAAEALRTNTDGWPFYIKGLHELERGEVTEAVADGRIALQRSKDVGHAKHVWRASVLLAHALAESLRAEEAAEILPPLSSRVDAQDTIYDATPRIRVRQAAHDLNGALAAAREVDPQVGNLVSPADGVAEVMPDPKELRAFLDALPVRGEALASPRLAVVQGRLALMEGRLEDAARWLGEAVSGFTNGGLALGAWHAARALAEAEFRLGDADRARGRLEGVLREARAHGALLAAELAAETASRLGIKIEVAEAPVEVASSGRGRVATGERMVTVLFADVRGFTALAGEVAPADLSDRVAALQRWATQEVERRHGIVDKFAGDAVMATFNVSGQSVDHTLQALRAAVAIIDKAALAGLPVGAGIAVGPAVVGNLAASANLSVLGEATNLASRLQNVASGGEVLLAEEAYRRSREWLEAQQIQAEQVKLELKGIPGNVLAYRVATGLALAAPA